MLDGSIHDRCDDPPRRVLVRDAHRDSTRWDTFTHRPDDIVIASSYKSGTTLTQQIVNLLLRGPDDPRHFRELSPWVDSVHLFPGPAVVDAIPGRRFLKSHLPFDALPHPPGWRYIFLTRDGRDVCLSLFEHNRDLAVHRPVARDGRPIDYGSADFGAFFDAWLPDGYPTWSFWDDAASWWRARHRPEVLLLHFDELVGDKPRTVRRIAEHLDLPWTPSIGEMVCRCSSLAYMKGLERAGKLGRPVPKPEARFVNKGTNGRWRERLSAEQIARFHAMLAQRLPPECAAWVRGDAPAD